MKRIIIAFFLLSLPFPAFAYKATFNPFTGKPDKVGTDNATDLNSGLCAANEILKKNAGNTAWECAADAGAAGGDSVTVNGSATTDANLLNNDIVWTLDTATNPDNVTGAVQCSGCVDSTDILNGTINTQDFNSTTGTGSVVLSEDAAINVDGGTLEVPNSITLPGTCAVGEVYMDTDATSGQRVYACESTNTWVLQGDGGAGGGDSVLVDTVAIADASGVDLTGGTTGIDITLNAGVSPDTATFGLDLTEITCGAGVTCASATAIATASSEADFLTSGALTCGASTQGKVQTHTTPLQYCDNAATPALQYAAYGNSTGVATSATALAANGANCSAGSAPLGVDASGAVESCTDYEEDLLNSAGLAAALSDEVGTGVAVFGTSPDFTTSIDDSGGNELFKLTATASAVNEFTVANAAATGDPVLSTTGSDTNIDIGLTAKGTGGVIITSTGTGPSTITHGLTVNNDGVSTVAGDDFVHKGNTDDNLIFSDASADAVGIGDGTPTSKLTVAGHIITSGTAPTIGTCGTTPAIGTGSTDQSGFMTVGTGGTATSCAITFATAWPKAPYCWCNHQGAILYTRAVATTTALTCDAASALTASGRLDYGCEGNE